jgi:DNA excision repair protein ERCC-2
VEVSYVVAVRTLCEFTAKQGDLDRSFTPSPTAQEGIAGHAVVAARRGESYQAEVSLDGEHGLLKVRGRADGYDPEQNLLEEIKTYRGQLASMPANHRHLHWSQLRVYGHLLCRKLELNEVNLALVYFDIGTQSETVLRETQSAEALSALFIDLCTRFSAWAELEQAHRLARDEALSTLQLPYPDFRVGQRQLAENVFKAAVSARCLLAQAPTGIGKTIGCLFPALRAMPKLGLDRVFYLAAKTPGRQLALDAITTIRRDRPALPLRVLELTARDKSCEHPDKECHGQSCPLANGFYDRLPAARAAASNAGTLDSATLRTVALQHNVCPYYLSIDMAQWSDVIVGDYNYYFDAGALLYGLTLSNQWRVNVLVDEAHNMVSRARAMYSAQLDRAAWRAACAAAPPVLNKVLKRVGRAWPRLTEGVEDGASAGIPQTLLTALQGATSSINDVMADDPAPINPALQTFYFNALHFLRLSETFGEHSMFDVSENDTSDSALCIRNIVPAPFLKPRFALSHSTVLFSATLSPWNYFSDTLGMPSSTAWVDVASPFDARQLSVHVVRHISTRLHDRARSAAPIVALIARQYESKRGNYLAFFSSFDYLEQVAARFVEDHPTIPCWQQERHMDQAGREAFLARFTAQGCGIGFAVLGGAFGVGIDLPGTRLIGAFVATLGLPQMNRVNEQIRRRMHAVFGAGYDYTYLYPGIQKVVQAAGRVIRTNDDQGVLYLIDDRFGQAGIQQLLPSWWAIQAGNHNTPAR